MRGDKRISLRLFLLLLFSGGLMGWMVLVITAYYVVRTDENQWAQRNIEAITNIAPAAGGHPPAASGPGGTTAAPSR
jgi:hypothetical protein